MDVCLGTGLGVLGSGGSSVFAFGPLLIAVLLGGGGGSGTILLGGGGGSGTITGDPLLTAVPATHFGSGGLVFSGCLPAGTSLLPWALELDSGCF